MIRWLIGIFLVCAVAIVGVLGFRGSHFRKPPLYIFPDMERQAKLRPQKPNGLFANGISSQPVVPGAIPRGEPLQTTTGPVYPCEDAPVNTGLAAGTTNFVEINPLAITAELLARGRQRFTIHCSPCHGGLADGNGITKKIGAMAVVANLHDQRIVEMPDGQIFDVITRGGGVGNLMGAYGPNITVADRWAIVAYVRALQLSRLGALEDVPQELRPTLKK
jgi:mono/diheme cytochrome c family protein